MSRSGLKPVPIPDGVDVELSGQEVAVSGAKGRLRMTLVGEVAATIADSQIHVRPRNESNRALAMWGMQRTLVSNMVRGVSTGYSIDLEINGVGYRAAVEGQVLTLQLGYSHDIRYAIPEGIDISCQRPTAMTVSGIDKQQVGQVAADIRAFRKPEPYKGKGIKYVNEVIYRKEGKKK